MKSGLLEEDFEYALVHSNSSSALTEKKDEIAEKEKNLKKTVKLYSNLKDLISQLIPFLEISSQGKQKQIIANQLKNLSISCREMHKSIKLLKLKDLDKVFQELPTRVHETIALLKTVRTSQFAKSNSFVEQLQPQGKNWTLFGIQLIKNAEEIFQSTYVSYSKEMIQETAFLVTKILNWNAEKISKEELNLVQALKDFSKDRQEINSIIFSFNQNIVPDAPMGKYEKEVHKALKLVNDESILFEQNLTLLSKSTHNEMEEDFFNGLTAISKRLAKSYIGLNQVIGLDLTEHFRLVHQTLTTYLMKFSSNPSNQNIVLLKKPKEESGILASFKPPLNSRKSNLELVSSSPTSSRLSNLQEGIESFSRVKARSNTQSSRSLERREQSLSVSPPSNKYQSQTLRLKHAPTLLDSARSQSVRNLKKQIGRLTMVLEDLETQEELENHEENNHEELSCAESSTSSNSSDLKSPEKIVSKVEKAAISLRRNAEQLTQAIKLINEDQDQNSQALSAELERMSNEEKNKLVSNLLKYYEEQGNLLKLIKTYAKQNPTEFLMGLSNLKAFGMAKFGVLQNITTMIEEIKNNPQSRKSNDTSEDEED